MIQPGGQSPRESLEVDPGLTEIVQSENREKKEKLVIVTSCDLLSENTQGLKITKVL